ncbi:MAG TPA: lytic murein transglycosylase [Solirubrobacteraceae bacterium]|jgi:hypothetical protein
MASGSPEHGPDQAPATGDRAPAARLRLAAGLAGAGVLAIGFGSGIVQTAAQDAPEGAPGEGAVGTPADQPVVAPAAAAPSESPSAAPAPAATETRTETSTAAATISSTGEHTEPAPQPQPAPEQPAAAPEQPAQEQPPAEQPPAAEAPKPEEPAAQAAAEEQKDDAWSAEDETCPADEGDVAASGAAAAALPAAEEAPVAPATGTEATLPEQAAGDDCKVAAKEGTPVRRERRHAPKHEDGREHKPVDRTPTQPRLHSDNGVPTLANPSMSLAMPGPAAIGVPNFFIDKFRIPPFLLPIYQAAGMEYGVRWEVLAAINEIETDYGRNLNVSSAGALGWMQFMPSTWKSYGVDANGDGKKDPYNPVDAIFAAAKYLKAAGAETDLRRAIFAYNHADWYVESVLMRARLVGGLPGDLVGSLTGLTQGRFPLDGKARYASGDGDSTLVFAQPGTAAIATHDGKVVARGHDKRLGRYVKVRDAYGNTYTYGRLSELEVSYPVPKHGAKAAKVVAADHAHAKRDEDVVEPRAGSATSVAGGKERLFANPTRPHAYKAGGNRQVGAPVPQGRDEYVAELLRLKPNQVTWKRLKPGASIVAGTVLGHVGQTSSTRAPHMLFELRPAGRGAPRIDPKPILDGWKLLESTAIYRAKGKNPFFGRDAKAPTIGQILLMSKESLIRRVLANPHVDVYECGRQDIRAGIVDRRVLALLEFLAANGLRPGVTSLQCGHGFYTSSGNVSHHSTGTAVDIASVNGISIMGHQGAGSITDIAIRRILTLQGAMRPDQVISLMKYPDAPNTLAMGDHADHIHVGYQPVGQDPRTGRVGKYAGAILKPGQWRRVIDRLGEIENPVVAKKPSKVAIKVTPKRHGNAGRRAFGD